VREERTYESSGHQPSYEHASRGYQPSYEHPERRSYGGDENSGGPCTASLSLSKQAKFLAKF
jgi:hypothetical protein